MKDELERKLIEKYSYMFKEKERSVKILQEQNRLTHEIIIARKNNDTIKLDQLKEESQAIGSYYPIAFGLSCDDGWYDLLDKLMNEIQEVDVDKLVEIHQVKEKLGGLRFYINDGSVRLDVIGQLSIQSESKDYFEKIREIINRYENESYSTCEVCGKEGKLCTNKYWLKTVCKEHRKLETNSGDITNYIPINNYIKNTSVITPEKELLTVVTGEYRENEDKWFYILSNGKTYSQDDLTRQPHNNLYEDWFVKDNTGTEYLVVGKRYNPIEGWIYKLILDDPALIDKSTEVEKKEEELEPVFVEINGYKRIKHIEKLKQSDK